MGVCRFAAHPRKPSGPFVCSACHLYCGLPSAVIPLALNYATGIFLSRAHPLRGRWPEGPDEVATKGESSQTCPLISRLWRQPFLWSAFGVYCTCPGMRRWRIPVSGSLPEGKPLAIPTPQFAPPGFMVSPLLTLKSPALTDFSLFATIRLL